MTLLRDKQMLNLGGANKSQIDIQLFKRFIELNLKNLIKNINFAKLGFKINLMSKIQCLMQEKRNGTNYT
jgi:hypothetical protein